jgi:hypothetical protein
MDIHVACSEVGDVMLLWALLMHSMLGTAGLCCLILDLPIKLCVAHSNCAPTVQQLLGRWALLPALVRVTSARLSPSVFDAPVTPRVYCASIRVVGLSTLLAWDQQVSQSVSQPLCVCLDASLQAGMSACMAGSSFAPVINNDQLNVGQSHIACPSSGGS